jgi:hypothetical protein
LLMNLLQWWRRRRNEREAELRATDRMRRAGEPREPVEPKEAKLSQLRD